METTPVVSGTRPVGLVWSMMTCVKSSMPSPAVYGRCGRRADRELDVVGKAVAVGVLGGAGLEDEARGQIDALPGSGRDAIAIGDQAGDRVEDRDVIGLVRRQEEAEIAAGVADGSQGERAAQVRKLDSDVVVAPVRVDDLAQARARRRRRSRLGWLGSLVSMSILARSSPDLAGGVR